MPSIEQCILPVILITKEVQRVGLRFQLNAGCHVDSQGKPSMLESWGSTEFLVDIDYLKSLDPKEWKDQDHYCVLGLGSLRYNATDDDIRRAYRKMVLQHHPDKRKSKGEEVNADTDYFTCITKAYEILGSQKLRRAYDSVDPKFDDSLPTLHEMEQNFYEVFKKYFDLNSRWSERKDVPSFGDENSNREDVDSFYSFWYDFESWREFSYLDEEDKEKGQDRDERRWIEKQNKAARIKRKKEEMSRIRSLVDLAYNNDKRIVKFKNEEKQRKVALKRAKMDAVQAQKDEMERALKEAQLAKDKAEKAEQKRIEKIRFEKEQYKKAIKKERKLLREKAKENNYFSSNEKDMIQNMEGVEKICEMLNLCELQNLNKGIEENNKQAFLNALITLEEKLRIEKEGNIRTKVGVKSDLNKSQKDDMWTNERVQNLIKAVNLFPAGTAQRWEVIATFLNQHDSTGRILTSRDILIKAKSLQQSDFSKSSLKTDANDGAFLSFQKSKREVQVIPENVSPEVAHDTRNCLVTSQSQSTFQITPSKQWTKEEQALLEQAIKSFPITTPDRWDRISECIPNRSKKDCLRRVKELVDLVNSKKDAKQSSK